MALTDDIQNLLSQGQTQAASLFDIFAQIWIIIVITIGTIILAILLLRFLKHHSDYAGDGEKKGAFTISIMGWSWATGNLSTKNDLTYEMFEGLRKFIPEIAINYNEFEKRVKNEELFFYDFRVTELSKTWTQQGRKDILIVSTAKLESDDFSWEDKKGHWSITGLGFKHFPRNVDCWIKSFIKEDWKDPYGKEIDAWFLSPIPKTAKLAVNVMFPDQEKYYINVVTTEYPEAILKSANMLPTLVEVYKEIDIKEEEIKNRDEIIEGKNKQLSALNLLVNKYRHLLNFKVFVGFAKPQTPKEKIIEWGWIIGAFFLGAFSYGEIPKSFPQAPNWLIALAVFIIILSVRKLSEKNKPVDKLIQEEIDTQ